MSSTIPESPGETPDLEHVYALVCELGDELAGLIAESATLRRIFSAPPEAPAESTEGIPEVYTDPVACRARARRRRRRESGLRVAR